ncbi:MAG: hypothetical protein R3C53_11155 [Pirellulaceae bacterium]
MHRIDCGTPASGAMLPMGIYCLNAALIGRVSHWLIWLLAYAATVGLTHGQTPSPQDLKPLNTAPLEVLMRMDRNSDGILHRVEIPVGAEEFVDQIAMEADWGLAAEYDLGELSFAWLQFDQQRPTATVESQAESALHRLELEAIPWAEIGSLALTMSAAAAAAGIDPELELLARMDANRDGTLHPDEVPLVARAAVAAQLKADGYSPKRPIRLKELASRRQKARLDGQTTAPRQIQRVDATETEYNAQRLLKTYDKDQDGYLQREEWSRLGMEWQAADKNQDQRLSAAEIAAHLVSTWNRSGQ